ncbi:MAG: AbrB/MazE/SpoVT family DNA-binding domain-containing protein [Terracidiphilus sp.]|jgi:AbrB family looped-hinge helix DNA binding protein
MGSTITKPTNASSKINQNGRIVIPAAIREQMGLSPGDTLFMSVEGDVLKLESHRARVRRVQEEFKKYVKPGEMLMSDQLIAERREEARREMEEWLG